MDIGSIVAWIQGVMWAVALILWIGRIVRKEAETPSWLKSILSSNGLIGTVVVLGLISTGITFYISHRSAVLNITISAYQPQYPSPMRVVKDQAFENTDIPLDGYDYDHDTFTNVCFLYDGSSYELQNVTIKGGWRICTKDQRLQNYSDLMDAMQFFDRGTKHSSHSVVVQH